MSPFLNFIESVKVGDQRSSNLAAALFENKISGYVCYRLSYFFLRFFLHCTVFIAEYYILSYIFKDNLLYVALAFRFYLTIVTGFWWGALEVLRSKIRELVYGGKKHLVSKELSNWISFSVFISLFNLITAIVLLGLMWTDGINGKLISLYVFSINLRISIQVFIQTMHSGVYALSRIFRPFWSILIIDTAGFVLTLVYWPFFGNISLPLATISSSILLGVIAFNFINRAYKLIDCLSFRISIKTFIPAFLCGPELKNFLLQGFASATMRLDGLAVTWVLFCSYFSYFESSNLSEAYLIIPFLEGSFSWAILFYFDFKKLDNPELIAYEQTYKKYIFKLSIAMGLVFWMLYCFVSGMLTNHIAMYTSFILLPLFLTRSLFSYFQVRAFCENKYIEIIVSSLLGIMTCISILMFFDLRGWNNFIPILSLGFSLLYLVKHIRINVNKTYGARVVSLGYYIRQLRLQDDRIRIGYVKLLHSAPVSTQVLLSRFIAEKLSNNGMVCCSGKREIFWFSNVSIVNAVTVKDIVVNSAGLSEKVLEKEFNDSDDAMDFIQTQLEVDKYNAQLYSPSSELSLSHLARMFKEIFPEGKYIYYADKNLIKDAKNDPHYKQLVYSAYKYLKSYVPHEAGNGYQVSALLTWSRIEAIFAIPIKSTRAQKNRWNSQVRNLNLSRALASE